jgi:hypothetical protein
MNFIDVIMEMKSKVLGVIVFFVSTFLSDAASAENASTLYLGAGATFFGMKKNTTSETGKASLLGETYLPHVLLTVRMPFIPVLNLAATASYTPIAVKGPDNVSKRIMNLGLAQWFDVEGLDLKAGFSYMVYSIGGNGEDRVLPNGNSTQTFYAPSTTVSSKNINLMTGIGWEFISSIRFDLDLIATSAFSQRRSFSSLLSISKGIF